MKKFYSFLVVIFVLSNCVFCQGTYTDVVYLKNGSIIRGVVIEQEVGKSIKIQTADKNVFVYQVEEVEKIAKEITNIPPQQTSESLTQGNENYGIINISRNASPHEWNQRTGRIVLMVYADDNPVCELPYKTSVSIKVFNPKTKLFVKFIPSKGVSQDEIEKYYFSGRPIDIEVEHGKTSNATIVIEELNGMTLSATANIELLH